MMALCVNPVRGVNKVGSVGMPLPDIFVRIVDADDGVTVVSPGGPGGSDAVGEICIAAPQLMQRFWERADGPLLPWWIRHPAVNGSPATWATWMPMATCSSSIARRT